MAHTAKKMSPALAPIGAAVRPSGATSGVTLLITGTGFNTTAANNVVTFTPSSGSPLAASAKTVATIDAASGLRRLTAVVPDGLPIGTTALTVTNTSTGDIGQGASFELVGLTVSGTTTASPGSTGVQIVVQGSPNAAFINGATKLAFGAGLTLTALTIDSATLPHATLSIAPSAALGPRAMSVSTSTQTLVVLNAFTVGTAPANRAPTVSAGTAATITLPAGASLNGSCDPSGACLANVSFNLAAGGYFVEARATFSTP
jgi:hypothetical protein